LDLRIVRDRSRFEEFLRAVAGTPATFDGFSVVANQPRWIYWWREATDAPGLEVHVTAAAEVDGCIQFTISCGEASRERVPSTIYPYSLAWELSVRYARSILDAAKVKALAAARMVAGKPGGDDDLELVGASATATPQLPRS
jgi:hypothetical protein